MKKSTFFKDFKEFIAKGNVVDLAVGVVIGGAFKDIVNALVNNIIMPLIGLVTGGASVADLKWVITAAELDAEGNVLVAENALLYGAFIQTIIDFLIIALCIFTVLRVMMKLKSLTEKKEEPAPAPEAPAEPVETTDDILKDIRELLKK
ncbi:MAG: large-conductance mechanosensitive channel protein MscL [Ruminococcaceae bacterium]|nr:large-conductance mechanosensitive channel protein MscL [Oscillospiraceae bacterium]